jgi:hypothetical protein
LPVLNGDVVAVGGLVVGASDQCHVFRTDRDECGMIEPVALDRDPPESAATLEVDRDEIERSALEVLQAHPAVEVGEGGVRPALEEDDPSVTDRDR